MVEFYNNTKIEPTLADIEHLEQELNIVLPDAYKAHMLKYNGGKTTCDNILEGVDGDEHCLFNFIPLLKGKNKRKNFLKKRMKEDAEYISPGYHTIAVMRTGYLAMSFKKEDYGQLFMYYSECELEKIAHSFTDFVNRLEDESEITWPDPDVIEDEEYDAYVSKYKLDLPESYRKFLHQLNGGVLSSNTFQNESGKIYEIDYFFKLIDEDTVYEINGVGIPTVLAVLKIFQVDDQMLPLNLFPFAARRSEGIYCFEMKGPNKGAVIYFDLGNLKAQKEPVSNDLGYLIENMVKP